MKLEILGKFVVIIWLALRFGSSGFGAVGDVVQQFPSPGTWPEGLAWDGRYLWNADGYGRRIYKLNPADGSIVASYDSPGTFPEGLVFAQGYLYNCDWDTGLIYKCEVTATSLNVVSTMDSPGARAIGLTFDGRSLWHAAWEQRLYKLRMADGIVLNEYATPDLHPEDLAWDGTNLWLTDWYSRTIYKLNPTTGEVLLSFPSPGNRSVGLTFDGQYLWNSDTSGTIYKIEVGLAQVPSLQSIGVMITTITLGVLVMGFTPCDIKKLLELRAKINHNPGKEACHENTSSRESR